MRVVINFGNMSDDTIEKCAVVTDHDERTFEIKCEFFELFKSDKIEIVRRFIKHQDVKTRQQQCGQPHPCRLTTRQRGHQRTQSRIGQTDFGHDCLNPRLKVGSTQIEPAFKCIAITIVRAGFAL